jgi:hypothetical protein
MIRCSPPVPHNLNPKRYVWRAKGEQILAKIQRAWKAALGENKDVAIISETVH